MYLLEVLFVLFILPVIFKFTACGQTGYKEWVQSFFIHKYLLCVPGCGLFWKPSMCCCSLCALWCLDLYRIFWRYLLYPFDMWYQSILKLLCLLFDQTAFLREKVEYYWIDINLWLSIFFKEVESLGFVAYIFRVVISSVLRY